MTWILSCYNWQIKCNFVIVALLLRIGGGKNCGHWVTNVHFVLFGKVVLCVTLCGAVPLISADLKSQPKVTGNQNNCGKWVINMTHSQMLGKFEYTRGPIFKVVLEC